MGVHLVIDVDPPLLRELIERVLTEATARSEADANHVYAPPGSLTVVAVVSGDAAVTADVVVRLADDADEERILGWLFASPAPPEPVASLEDLTERLRALPLPN